MGTWGPGISSNDTYADIYTEYFDLYNEGIAVDEISTRLISRYRETIDDPYDANNFWFALAKAQWECKQLDQEVLERVRIIIESGQDLEVWRELDADENDIKKRKVVLDKFLSNLQTERPKARARKKKIIRNPVFEKGDCLTYTMANGNYTGAVVLEAIYGTEYPYNLIVCTRINQPHKPTKKDFEDAEVLMLNFANWDNKPNVLWYYPRDYKKITHLIDKVDQIIVRKKFDIHPSLLPFGSNFERIFIEIPNMQFESEKSKPKPSSRETIQDWTRKKPKWKFWKSDD